MGGLVGFSEVPSGSMIKLSNRCVSVHSVLLCYLMSLWTLNDPAGESRWELVLEGFTGPGNEIFHRLIHTGEMM